MALVDAAVRLAREGGPEAVVLREAARQVGVSPTAAYRHFTNHDDLLHAVKERALTGLAERMEAEIAAGEELADPVADALRRLRAIGQGYVSFAVSEPGLFRTACCRTDKPEHTAVEAFSTRPFRMLTQVLDTLAEYGKIGPRHRPYAEIAAWATVHGLATLVIDGPLARVPEDVRKAACARTFDAITDGICQAD